MQRKFIIPLTTAVLGVSFCFGGLECLQAADGATSEESEVSHGDKQRQPSPDAAKDGSVWGALVYACNSSQVAAKGGDGAPPQPKDPQDFPDLSKRLGKTFPYDRFVVIGHHTQEVLREYESWVVPSREVFLKLDSKGNTADGGLNLHLQFWRGRQVLVKSDIVLQPDSPLFIGGPKWRDGQLIFVLELKETNKAK